MSGKRKVCRDCNRPIHTCEKCGKPFCAACTYHRDGIECRTPAAARDAFFAEFDAGTQPHPFAGIFRVWDGRVVFEVKPLVREFWHADVSLSAIQSLERGRGDGSRALDWFLELARRHGVTVVGHVQRIGKAGLTAGQLRAWYKRHGFTVSRSGDLKFGG